MFKPSRYSRIVKRLQRVVRGHPGELAPAAPEVPSAQPTEAQELFHSIVNDVLAGWRQEGAMHSRYVAGYASTQKVNSILHHYWNAVALQVPGYAGSIGMDFGCWLGFSSLALAVLGANVCGVDLVADYVKIAQRWADSAPIRNLRFIAAADGRVPVASGSLDWVVINQVLCNALPDSFETSLRETARVLRTGGWLVLSDSNNPHCPATIERLIKVYHDREIGCGSYETPAGSNLLDRQTVIQELAPDLAEQETRALAMNTCYMWGPQLVDAVQRYLATGERPDSVFKEGLGSTPRDPRNGAALGNLTDPFVLSEQLRASGFDTVISVSPSRQQVPEQVLRETLARSQGFYVYAQKCPTAASPPSNVP